MPVTRKTLRLVDNLRTELDTVVDTQTRDLVRAWATAWDEVAPDLNAALAELLVTPGERITRAQMLRSQRLMRSLAVIADRLEDLAADAGVRITGDLAEVIDTAGAAQASIIDSQLPAGSDLVNADGWDRVDARQIEAIVKRSTQQITSRTKPLSAEAYSAVRRELIRGIAAGSNPRDTARRMVRRVEGRFNGGLTRAMVIARTETLDAHREAARIGQAQQADVMAGWSWHAQLDSRTCPACWAKHGTAYDVTDPGPWGHQQCRCTRLPRTKTWRELGFDVDEPPSLVPDAGQRFAELPEADQLQVLGPRRFEAWQAGDYPMSEWAVRRSNPGWRDGFYVSPAPSGGRRSRNAA